MKLRHLLILGLLVFLNGFVLTVLFLMVTRQLTRPAATPTRAVAMQPTVTPTATSTPTQVPSPTNTRLPAPTNTRVVGEATPTATYTPAPPTSTPVPATATAPPATATATTVSPSPTATPTATTAVSYDFRYVQGSMVSAPNCGTVYMEGKITGVGGEPVDGRTVRLRFAGNEDYKVSGEGKSPGEFGFAPLAPDNYHSPFTFQIDIVDSQANPVPQSDTAKIAFSDCSIAGQFTNITFEYAR